MRAAVIVGLNVLNSIEAESLMLQYVLVIGPIRRYAIVDFLFVKG